MLKQFREANQYLLGSTEETFIEKEKILLDPQEFYEWVGLLNHPRTGEPVQRLAWWQYDIWKAGFEYKRRMVIKSQKVGESFAALEEDFQRALTVCKGKDILVVGQTQYHADEHLLKLKTRIINSKNARKYLITEPSELLFREQKTKVKIATIKNPDNPLQPTRIIALGMAESGMWSWSNVGHIHMSDPTVSPVKDDAPLFAAALSRLASTDGTMLVESPPRGPHGKVFEIYNQYLMKQENLEPRDFKIFHVTAQDAVKEGMMTQEFLDEQRNELGALFPQYYQAQFISVSGNLFSQAAIDKAVNSYKYEPDEYNERTEKVICIDQGYSTSKFALIVAEWIPGIMKLRILAAEEHQSPTTEEMINRILVYRKRYGNVQNIGYDATSRMEFGMTLKQKIDEPYRVEYIKDKIAKAKGSIPRLARMMKVVPIIFTTESKGRMAQHTRRLLEDPRQFIAIHPRFIDLIMALRTAIYDDQGRLDKDLSAHDDLTDTFQMMCEFFYFGESER
jgi:hypothetical protein